MSLKSFMAGNIVHTRPALLWAMAFLACSTLAGCGRDGGNAGRPGGSPASPSAPSPSPTPTTPAPFVATPVPFNVVQSRAFDILGWDSWPGAPTPSAIQLRWDAAMGQ